MIEIFELILRGIAVVIVLAAAFGMGWLYGYERGQIAMLRKLIDRQKRYLAERFKP